MGAINNLLEKAKYFMPSVLGGKSREQIAEEERKATEQIAEEDRKAAEQKAREEQVATMAREKKEREADEKSHQEFADKILGALKSNYGVTYKLEIINAGARDSDLSSGRGIATQRFKLEIYVDDDFSATISVMNNPESYKYNAEKVEKFLGWGGCEALEPEIKSYALKRSLAKENTKEQKMAAKNCMQIINAIKECPEIPRCIEYMKQRNRSELLVKYKNECMPTLQRYSKQFGALEIMNNNGEFQISLGASKIDFNHNTFEFKKNELASALGCHDCRSLSDTALRLFEKRVKEIASKNHNLTNPLSVEDLEGIIAEHTSKTSIEINLINNNGLYDLLIKNRSEKPQLCERVTIGEAFGTIQRRMEEFDYYRPAHKIMDVSNGLDKLCAAASNSINRGNIALPLDYSIYESGGPGLYKVDFFQLIKDPSGKSCKVGGYGFNPRTINDLMEIINNEISDPQDLIDVINKNIEAKRSEWRPKHKISLH